MTRATTSLIKLPSDFATELGQRFLRILLARAGLGFDRNKTAQALTRGAFGILEVVERKQARAEITRKKALDELESGLKFQATLDIEQVIRQDLEIKAYDTLRCRCNELADRLGAVVSAGRECPSDLKEAVSTIIWAAGQAEVPLELTFVKTQLSKKYGKSLIAEAEKNEGGCVDKSVATRLSFQADPPPLLVKEYMAKMTAEVEERRKMSSPPSSPCSFFSRIKMKPRAPSSTTFDKENANATTARGVGGLRKKNYWRSPAQLRTHPMDDSSENTL